MDNVERMLTSIVVEDAKKGPVELRFSHIVSTPRGNYAVFVLFDDEEAPTVRIFKLTEIDDGEEEEVCHHWADIARELGEEGWLFLKSGE